MGSPISDSKTSDSLGYPSEFVPDNRVKTTCLLAMVTTGMHVSLLIYTFRISSEVFYQ